MTQTSAGIRTIRRLAGATLLLALTAACDDITIPDSPSSGSVAPAASATAAKELPDSIVGKWQMLPAIGTGSRGCPVEFKASSLTPGKGRVSTLGCNQVEGLGGLHGVSDITAWERKGDTIVLSGIAAPNIGTIDLPARSFSDRVNGVTREDGIRFVIVRQ